MPAVILAAGFDWLEGLVGVLFVVVWIVSQIVNVIRAARGAAKPVAKPNVRPRPDQPPVPPAADPREALARQIEEFLRRSEPDKQPPRPPAPPQRKPVGNAERRPTGERRPPAPQPPRRTPPAPPAAPATVAPPPVGSEVAAHVRKAFAGEIAHLHSPLETGGTNLAATVPVPHPLVTLLRDPAALRQLVLVREVLDRPLERW